MTNSDRGSWNCPTSGGKFWNALRRLLRARLAKHSETSIASLCVTCPNREFGFCGPLFGPVPENSKIDRQPDWQRFVAARADEQIVSRNHVSNDVFVLCTGWAFRYFQLSDGGRQILKFLLPGELFSPVTVFEGAFHFSVKALTGVRVCDSRAPKSARSTLPTLAFNRPS